jgi:hypothetical protein
VLARRADARVFVDTRRKRNAASAELRFWARIQFCDPGS